MEMIPPGSTALAPGELRRRCDPAQLAFATTAELEPLDVAPGQARAAQAIDFGVGMRREGYNLFAMGPEGAGRHSLVRRRLRSWPPEFGNSCATESVPLEEGAQAVADLEVAFVHFESVHGVLTEVVSSG